MKYAILLSFVAALSSCTTGGPTIRGLGAGSDASYLNAERGRADAQISEQQARQYSRQRQQVSEEMELVVIAKVLCKHRTLEAAERELIRRAAQLQFSGLVGLEIRR
jgi:hypothetical protein